MSESNKPVRYCKPEDGWEVLRDDGFFVLRKETTELTVARFDRGAAHGLLVWDKAHVVALNVPHSALANFVSMLWNELHITHPSWRSKGYPGTKGEFDNEE